MTFQNAMNREHLELSETDFIEKCMMYYKKEIFYYSNISTVQIDHAILRTIDLIIRVLIPGLKKIHEV
jgi:hypothetical protein